MKAKLRKFRVEDLYDLELHECYASDENPRDWILGHFQAGSPLFVVCMPESDRPLAIVGGHKLYPKVAECWSLVGKDVLEHPFYYAEAMKRIVKIGFDFYGLERMQISIKADQKWAQKWARFLGFELEGEMKSYGAELVSYFLFAKIRGQNGR